MKDHNMNVGFDCTLFFKRIYLHEIGNWGNDSIEWHRRCCCHRSSPLAS